MNETIDIHVLYTAEDYARGAKYIQQRNFIVKYGFLFPIVIIALVLIWLYFLDPITFASAFSQSNNIIVLLIVPVIVVPFLYFVSRSKSSFLVRRQFAKQIASSPAMQQPQKITFDHEGIEGKTILGAGETRWEAVIEGTETDDDFYFFTAKKFAMFVPKRVFESEEQQNRLRHLMVDRLGERAKSLQLAHR